MVLTGWLLDSVLADHGVKLSWLALHLKVISESDMISKNLSWQLWWQTLNYCTRMHGSKLCQLINHHSWLFEKPTISFHLPSEPHQVIFQPTRNINCDAAAFWKAAAAFMTSRKTIMHLLSSVASSGRIDRGHTESLQWSESEETGAG